MAVTLVTRLYVTEERTTVTTVFRSIYLTKKFIWVTLVTLSNYSNKYYIHLATVYVCASCIKSANVNLLSPYFFLKK